MEANHILIPCLWHRPKSSLHLVTEVMRFMVRFTGMSTQRWEVLDPWIPAMLNPVASLVPLPLYFSSYGRRVSIGSVSWALVRNH